MMDRSRFRIAFVIALCAWSVACSSDTAAPAAANMVVYLSAAPDPSINRAPAHMGAAVRLGTISPAAVDSINILFRAVAAIRPGTDVNYAAEVPLSGAALQPINFRTLPETGEDSLEVARGPLDPAGYTGLRLRFYSATITFNQEVSAGGMVFGPGTYPLEITHGITFATDVPVTGFTIDSSVRTVVAMITFDIGSSISSITTDEFGKLVMNPVVRATVRH